MTATPENAMLTAAKYWAGKGFPVFPLKASLKIPDTGDGFKSATTDMDTINQWFANHPHRNIGFATGAGIAVIDIDTKDGVDGFAALGEVERRIGALPDTLTVRTPSQGEHRYYRYPPAVDVRCSAKKLADNVDVRADGGYVVAPPSHTDASADSTGKTATGEYVITNKSPIADLPAAWLDLMARKHEAKQPPPPHRHNEPSNEQRLTEIRGALAYINATPHDEWVKVGMALHALGDDGLSLWDAWSKTAPNYNATEIPKRWKSFAGSSVNVETIYFLATQNGWQNPAKGRKPEQTYREDQGRAAHQQRDEHRSKRRTPDDTDHVRLVSGLSIIPRQMEWAWKDWLPKGKLSLLVGAPKTGKTMLAIDIAATITRGGKFPDGTRANKASVIFWTAEDDLEDTISPRFKAAGGDLANVHFIGNTVSSGQGQPFNPAQDMPLLMDAIHRMEKPPALLIIDPVVSVTQDMNNALQVRMSLLPVVEMAQQHGMAVLGITHFRKSSGESGNLGERIIGSSAFLQVARMVWYAMKPPDMDTTRLFFKGDTNLAESDEGFLYEVESRDAEFPEHLVTVQTAGVVWGEKVDGEALQALIKPDVKADSAPVQAEAETFLKQFLATGARLKTEIEEEADNRGITMIALRRAKKAADIKHRRRRGDGKSEWYLHYDQVDQPHTPKKVDQVDVEDYVL